TILRQLANEVMENPTQLTLELGDQLDFSPSQLSNTPLVFPEESPIIINKSQQEKE
ncbi:3122_t:CDS:1, partial [Ambispora gerdemannii]